MRDGQVQAVTVDQGRDNAAVEIFLGAAAMVRLGLPVSDRLIPIPVALQSQAFLVGRATAMAMMHRTLVLKGNAVRQSYLPLSNLSDAELMQ